MFALQNATNYINADLPLRVEQLNNDIKASIARRVFALFQKHRPSDYQN